MQWSGKRNCLPHFVALISLQEMLLKSQCLLTVKGKLFLLLQDKPGENAFTINITVPSWPICDRKLEWPRSCDHYRHGIHLFHLYGFYLGWISEANLKGNICKQTILQSTSFFLFKGLVCLSVNIGGKGSLEISLHYLTRLTIVE